ncbi:MAG: ATP-dependent zinc metalloprotease FtsH, partial [Myxococcota bacterium]|nr:ATP-dependent zinc metalloprotease FtsH [Myxococcota bacterium]
GCDPVHKVTIIPRGMALGLTWTLPEADQFNMNEQQVRARIAMAMGGRVAEQEVFERITTGAGNDIEQATKLARKMVCEWGMSELGPVALAKQDGNVFLGKDIGASSDFSQQTQGEADAAIRKILDDAHERAETLVRDNRASLDALTEALLEFESIDGAEVKLIIDGTSLEGLRERREEAIRAAGEAAAEEEPAPSAPAEAPEPEPMGGSDGGLVTELPEPVGGMRQRLPDDLT